MRLVLFYHSLLSDWNHGNAHFLRGIVWELRRRGHEVTVYEQEDAWSRANLLEEPGAAEALRQFRRVYPGLESRLYDPATLDLDRALDGADAAIVHEWNEPALVARIGAHRAAGGRYRLLFHDTHHRAASDAPAMARYDLSRYDGVLAFGRILRDIYLERGWAARAWIWHEAADVRVFHPPGSGPEPDGVAVPDQRDAGEERGDLVWVGNWGDGERSAELHRFLLDPVRRLGLRATIYGVRYPPEARAALRAAGIRYGGWLPNVDAPAAFARHRVTVHVPRRPYTALLPGIPTIRVFEALACGIPLICSPWDDSERLFTPGLEYLVARDGTEMAQHLRSVLADPDLAASLRAHGLRTIHARHTCAHRVDELLGILDGLAG